MLLSTEQKTKVVKWYWESKSIIVVQRHFRRFFKTSHAPCARTILRLQEKFIAKGTVKTEHKGQSGRKKFKRVSRTVQKIKHLICKVPSKSIRKLAQEVGCGPTLVHSILHDDLKLKPYKIKKRQELSDSDKKQRLNFALWLKEKLHSEPQFTSRVWFSDEAHFTLHGSLNKQNNRIWSDELPPEAVSEYPLHSPKVTAWCALSASGVVGPFFFESPNGTTTTVDQHGYVEVLEKFWRQLQDDQNQTNRRSAPAWFQQDGAPAHTSNLALQWLHDHFGARLVSRKTATPWPAHSPDLTPMDFYLWGYLKSEVTKKKAKNLSELKDMIAEAVRGITPDTCARVIRQVEDRAEICIRQKGGHVENGI